MNDNFKKVNDFEEILLLAREKVEASEKDYCLNFCVNVSFDLTLLKSPQLLDALNLAQDFQNPDKPATLYINHGQHIGRDGINHVINELKNKHAGNRSLISLISQDHIVNSEDKPIPSLMILQFSLEDDSLYVTTYFRALEVSKFLRINLEEIRIIADKIYQEMRRFKYIKLTIFSFRAYVNENMNTLQRPKIELLDEIRLLKLMEKDPLEIAKLLEEKIASSTVVEHGSLMVMSRILEDDYKSQDVQPCLKSSYILQLIKKCIQSSEQLSLLRKSASHNGEINDMNNDFSETLKELIKEIEKCR